MVIGREARLSKALRLIVRLHPQSAAHFEIQRGDGTNHLQHRIEFLAVVDLAPGRAHAESGGTLFARLHRGFIDFIDVEQTVILDPSFVMRALGAVSAILGASAGLDGKQPAELNFPWIVELAVLLLSGMDEIEKRLMIDGTDLLLRPVVAQRCGFRALN